MSKYQNVSKSTAVRTGTVGPRRQHSKKDEQEFGKASKEFVLCSVCRSAYFDKSWHHKIDEDVKHFNEDKTVKFDICPACKMLKEKRYEGELVVKISPGINMRELINMIENSDEMARKRDVLDRVLWTENKPDGLHVFTSENQLAVRIGKKIKSSHGKGKLTIDHSHEEDVIRVHFEL